MRKKVVAGNWKMNMTPSEAVGFVATLIPMIKNTKAEVILCVPSIDIVPVRKCLNDSTVLLGAQNMFYEEKGAYTGEISANMLVDAGVKYVIVGHSERRQHFKEDNLTINKKIHKAIEHELIPIICCGETLEQRKLNFTLEFIKGQITDAFSGISAQDAINCIVAYEPIWAIGTGRVATSAEAQQVCQAIRDYIADIYDDSVAESIRILYGGSVNEENAASLFSQPDIDGGLVGGASLKSVFAKIVNISSELS